MRLVSQGDCLSPETSSILVQIASYAPLRPATHAAFQAAIDGLDTHTVCHFWLMCSGRRGPGQQARHLAWAYFFWATGKAPGESLQDSSLLGASPRWSTRNIPRTPLPQGGYAHQPGCFHQSVNITLWLNGEARGCNPRACRFESDECVHAPVTELAYVPVSETGFCGFDSHLGHQFGGLCEGSFAPAS